MQFLDAVSLKKYSSKMCAKASAPENRLPADSFHILPVSLSEVKEHVERMKQGKAADRSGVVSEMLKGGGD